jgi:UDP-3-O-[3-hydroxymyristoyl] glucosamine N-acyltransferase
MQQSYTLAEIAERFSLKLSGCLVGDASQCRIYGIATLAAADKRHISFFSNVIYRSQLQQTQAAAVILKADAAADCAVPCLVSENPYLDYAKVSSLFAEQCAADVGIHATAVIDASARIAPTASIGAHCVVAADVVIGEGVVLGSGCSVGRASIIGDHSLLHARTTIYHGVKVGSDVVIHSGAVIGSDGFGFAPNFAAEGAGGWQKIHQLGGVVIGDRVEIGANTCIDRGALDDTVIEDDVIIDNLVQIAHNVKIGKYTAIAACTGIAGSTEIGQHCTIAGAVGIVGHLRIADRVHITAKSLVTGSIMESGSYSSGTALTKTAAWRKNAVRFLQLESLFQRVRALEKKQNNS